ncbi:hypothetical protein Bpla01_41080 [Burkholderia plantarii]|nr:hypothetical protein Bpla01_41080 [Burkholderia plantarii]
MRGVGMRFERAAKRARNLTDNGALNAVSWSRLRAAASLTGCHGKRSRIERGQARVPRDAAGGNANRSVPIDVMPNRAAGSPIIGAGHREPRLRRSGSAMPIDP